MCHRNVSRAAKNGVRAEQAVAIPHVARPHRRPGARRKLMTDVVIGQEQRQEVAAPEWAVHVRKYAVEAIGAFFLTLVVAVSVLSHSVFTPLAAGAALMVMIYAGGHISGGHYNPAVTMGALVRGRIGPVEAVGYWIAQVAGGVIAGWIGRAATRASSSGPRPRVTGWPAPTPTSTSGTCTRR